MRHSSFAAALLLLLLSVPGSGMARGSDDRGTEVTAEGVGPHRLAALDAAFREAIGQGLGVRLDSKTVQEDRFAEGDGTDESFQRFEEKLVTRVRGAVRDYRVVSEGPDPLGYRIRIRAKVFDPGAGEELSVERVAALQGKTLGLRVEVMGPGGPLPEIAAGLELDLARDLGKTGLAVMARTPTSVRREGSLDVQLEVMARIENLGRSRLYSVDVEKGRGTLLASALDPEGRVLFTERIEKERSDRAENELFRTLARSLAGEAAQSLPGKLAAALIEDAARGHHGLRILVDGLERSPGATVEVLKTLSSQPGVTALTMRQTGPRGGWFDLGSMLSPTAFLMAAYPDLNAAGLVLHSASGAELRFGFDPGAVRAATAPPGGPTGAGIRPGSDPLPVVLPPVGSPDPAASSRPGPGTPPRPPAGGPSNPTPVLPAVTGSTGQGSTSGPTGGTPIRSIAPPPLSASSPAEPAGPAVLAAAGSLDLATRPDGARLFLDDLFIGRSPLSLRRVPAGDHTLRASLEKHQQVEHRFRLDASRGERISLDLPKAPTQAGLGYLTVTSEPPGAAIVSETGEQLGVTPAEKMRIAAGSYDLRLVAAGHLDAPFRVEVPKKDETRVHRILQVAR